MKNIKILFVIMLSTVILIPFITAKADGIELKPNKVSELNTQIYQEISNVLKTPLYLNFTDKNISGSAVVTVLVDNNGRIIIRSINGENKMLIDQIKHKIESRNMWTDTKYSGNIFTFNIKSCCKFKS